MLLQDLSMRYEGLIEKASHEQSSGANLTNYTQETFLLPQLAVTLMHGQVQGRDDYTSLRMRSRSPSLPPSRFTCTTTAAQDVIIGERFPLATWGLKLMLTADQNRNLPSFSRGSLL